MPALSRCPGGALLVRLRHHGPKQRSDDGGINKSSEYRWKRQLTASALVDGCLGRTPLLPLATQPRRLASADVDALLQGPSAHIPVSSDSQGPNLQLCDTPVPWSAFTLCFLSITLGFGWNTRFRRISL